MKMKASDLRAAIGVGARVLERRNTIPVLGTILVEAGGGKAVLTATDLDIAISATIDCDGDGRFCMNNAKGVAGMVDAGRGDDVEVSQVNAASADWQAMCGDMRANFATINADDFPASSVPSERWTALLAPDFLKVLARVSIAMSNEETRYYLNGVHLHHVKDWTYALAATDGHRLVQAMVEIPDAPAPTQGIIIPKKTVRTLLALAGKIKEPIRLVVGKQADPNGAPQDITDNGATRMQVDIGGDMPIRLTSKLIDGNFPDYRRVVPAAGLGEHRAIVSTADVRRVLAGFFGFVTQKQKALKVEFEKGGRVRLSVNSPENGQASITIPAEVTGGDFWIGFNGRYLLEMANATAGEKMMLECTDQSGPTRITDPNSVDMVTVLMPMRI